MHTRSPWTRFDEAAGWRVDEAAGWRAGGGARARSRGRLGGGVLALAAGLLALPGLAPAQGPETALDSKEEILQVVRDNPDMIRVEDHPDEDRLEIVLGPFDLAPGTEGYRTPIQLARIPFDGWIHGFSWKLRTGDGRKLPDRMLHHMNLIDPDRRELFSPIARRVAAAGRETDAQQLPAVAGYPMEEGTRLLVVGMFANPRDERVEDVYLQVSLDYTGREDAPRDRISIYPFYLDVTGPIGDKSFGVPPGRTVKTWEGSPAVDATILGVGGHLHDYGVELRLEDLTTGEVLWRAEADTTGRGDVTGVPTSHIWWKGGAALDADHRYRVTAVYRNPTDRPSPHGGMGVVAGAVRTDETDWPDYDPTNQAFLENLRRTVLEPRRSGGAPPASAGDSGRIAPAAGTAPP